MKKLPPELRREIFSEKSGQLVQLQRHAALLAGSVVLVQQTLDNSLIHSLDSQLVGGLGGGLVAGHHSGVKLLQSGLQFRLVGLVLLISDLGRKDILLGGLDVGQGFHLLVLAFHTDTHYSVFARQNQPPF